MVEDFFFSLDYGRPMSFLADGTSSTVFAIFPVRLNPVGGIFPDSLCRAYFVPLPVISTSLMKQRQVW